MSKWSVEWFPLTGKSRWWWPSSGTKQDDAQAQLRAYQQVRQIVADYQSKHPQFTDEVFIAGTPIFIAAQQEIIDHDLALLFPIVFLLVTSMLVFFFRKPLGVFLPLFNILFCTIWTLGLMALLKVPIDLLTECAAGIFRSRSAVPTRYT